MIELIEDNVVPLFRDSGHVQKVDVLHWIKQNVHS